MIFNYIITIQSNAKFIVFSSFGNVKAAFDCCVFSFEIEVSYSTFKRHLERFKFIEFRQKSRIIKVQKLERLTKFSSKNQDLKSELEKFEISEKSGKTASQKITEKVAFSVEKIGEQILISSPPKPPD
jgi:hypothetical protein